jgi:MFS superfamily sulfate permease-like transporter
LDPQAFAYAVLAGLPPQYGLYCSVIPLVVYAVTTTSTHTCIGPFALISLLVANLLRDVDLGLDSDSDASQQLAAYINAVMLTTLMTGLVQVCVFPPRAHKEKWSRERRDG